jgi:hypothetical protein
LLRQSMPRTYLKVIFMHNYQVKFLVRVHVRTNSADLDTAAARVRCSATAFVDPGDPSVELEDCEVEWLEADERDEDGWVIRAIDTGS